MTDDAIPVDQLKVADIRVFPVWKYSDCEVGVRDETFVKPVKHLPVVNLSGMIVGTKVSLANGARIWAVIGNIDAADARITEHSLALSVERDGNWFTLARYHDFDRSEKGPQALSKFLNLPVDEIFPIAYDIRQYANGEAAALAGHIQKEPRERLSRAEVIAMAVS